MCRSIDSRLLETIGLCDYNVGPDDEPTTHADADDYAHARLVARETALEGRYRARRNLDRKDGPRADGHERRNDERAGRKSYVKGGERRSTTRRYDEPVELMNELELRRLAHRPADY